MFGRTHRGCERRWGMDGLVKVLQYRGVVRKLVAKVKYRLVTDMVEELVEVVVSLGDFTAVEGKNWVVVPVPLHRSRLRERGFNQAEVIGGRLAEYFGWELVGLVERVRKTRPQVQIKGKKQRERRLENVRGAFGLNDKFQISNDKLGRVRVLLVDDVWTTGATMRECAKVLKRSGVVEVWGLVVAG